MTDDPRPLLTRALDQATALMTSTTDADLDRPTPCEGWDVRTMANHIVGVHHRLSHCATGGLPFEITSLPVIADDERAAALAAARADLDRTWGLDGSDDTILHRELVLPWGTMPGWVAGFGYVQEFTVHAWDLAVALGRRDELDPALAEAAEETARRILPADARGDDVPFGPVVEVPPDAGPYERLAAWLGRDPRVAA